MSYIRIKSGFGLTIKGVVKMEDDVFINQRFTLVCAKSVTLKQHVAIGWSSLLMDTDLHYVYDEDNGCIHDCEAPVVIENNVWLGNSCSVMKGTVIPAFSIVGSGSLVNKDFGAVEMKGNFFAGRPAKLKRTGLYRIFSREEQGKIEKMFREQNVDTLAVPEKWGAICVD